MAQVKKDKKAKVKIFTWKGVDRKGAKVSGEMEGASVALVKVHLRKQGINAKKVSPKGKPLFGGAKKIKPMDVCIFTRQLATMMKAGVPLVQAFDLVGESLDNESMRNLVKAIRDEVAGGGSLAGALQKHPRYFDDLFISLIDAGEQSGALETMLDRVATYQEKSEALKSKIKKALTYPIGVICVGVIVTGLLLVKVVPVFADVFSSFGAELPAFTQMVMNFSEWMQQWWFIIMVTMAGLLTCHKEAMIRSAKYSDNFDAFMLKAPVISGIIHASIYARFSRTLATTFAAGVPLVDALESVRGAAGNAVYAKKIAKIKEDVTTGIALNTAIKASNAFPQMLIAMIAIGEESGALDAMLEKMAIHYEQEVDDAVDNLTAMMEPMIMSVLGVLVGGLMIAMYMPIFQIGNVV
ncbi:MAG: type II secretion system F family protein [Pseudomonadales bacterium]|nr:type II secretion system F family protein [Pseudomonadales bacterium]